MVKASKQATPRASSRSYQIIHVMHHIERALPKACDRIDSARREADHTASFQGARYSRVSKRRASALPWVRRWPATSHTRRSLLR